jgi:hypothetical protein
MPTLTIEYRDEPHRIAQALAIAYVTQLRQIGARVGKRLDLFDKAIDDLEGAWPVCVGCGRDVAGHGCDT